MSGNNTAHGRASPKGLIMTDMPPESKIEITPEMIEAGIGEILDYDPEDHSCREIVIRILQSALRVSKRSRL